MKYFNVAEKNSSAKSIAALSSGENFNWREGFSPYNKIYEFEANVEGQNSYMIMTSVHGHISRYEYLEKDNWNVDPISLFHSAIKKTFKDENTINIVETLNHEVAQNCQGLIIWTDCDREGENIGYEIMEVCQRIIPNIQVYRAKFSEITETSIQNALNNLEQPDDKQNQAVNVRSELSMRIGFVFSQFQKKLFQRKFPKVEYKSLSYGITQFPTLSFVVQRYKEIENFTRETFCIIKVLHTLDGQTVEFSRPKHDWPCVCDKSFASSKAKLNAVVENIVVEEKYMRRPLPMTTVELMRLGSQKLNIRAKAIMDIADKLYRNGFISYPRTKTNFFSTNINLRDLVSQQSSHADWGYFARDILNWGIDPNNGTKTDQAHSPIYPTKYAYDLEGNEKRVYELITRNFLACVSKDAKGLETTVNINICGEKFVAIGSRILERNYLDVYPIENWTAKHMHSYEKNSNFEPTKILIEKEITNPPQLLTEADLIFLMAENGVGTDATYHKHISTLEGNGYIEFNDKQIKPGDIGLGLVEGYDAVGVPLAQPDLSSTLEAELNLICIGLRTPADVLSEQIEKYKKIYNVVLENMNEIAAKIAYRLNVIPTNVELKCEHCKNPATLLKVKKEGPNKGREFYKCDNSSNKRQCKNFFKWKT